MGNNIGSIGAPKQQIIGDDLPKKPVATIKQNANPQTESTTNAANQRANLNDYGAAMRFKLQNKLENNVAKQTLAANNDDAPRDFETIGGDWRVKNDDGSLKFYRTGENTDGTTRFDKEYFQIAETEFIHLNKNGALIDLPTNAGKPQPENVTDLDWFGHERVTPNRVPADYTSTGKTIAFDNPRDANDKTNVLKRYVVDNNLVKGTWDEAKAVNALKLAIADGVKVEITEIGVRADGKTEYAVKINNDDLQKLRGRLADYKREVSQDLRDGKAGGIEQENQFKDLGKIPYNAAVKTLENVVNTPSDVANVFLSTPRNEGGFAKAKIGGSPEVNAQLGKTNQESLAESLRGGLQKLGEKANGQLQTNTSTPSAGRAKIGEVFDESTRTSPQKTIIDDKTGYIGRVDLSAIRPDYSSEMMKRGGLGESVDEATSVLVPLVIGKVLTPKSPQTLKSSGALPEAEATVNKPTSVNIVDEIKIAANKEAERIKTRYTEIESEGHAVQRHGEKITETQLDERAINGKDPITGTTNDAYLKDAKGNPLLHRSGKNATKFKNESALVKAEDYVKSSQDYKDALTAAQTVNDDSFAIKSIKLEDVYGANYKNEVFGKTRVGSQKNPIGSIETDFTDGTITAVFRKDANGKWNLHTMYPEPKK